MKKAFIIIFIQLISAVIFSSISAFNSFAISMFFISFICAISSVFYTEIGVVNLRHVILILAPIYLSYIFYWFPLLNQPSNAEFKVWAFVFVVPGAVFGLLVSIIAYLISIKVQDKK